MNLDRFQRILKARWWFLALVVIGSVFLATQLTRFRNEQRPTQEAVATITFSPYLGEVDDTGPQLRLENAESLALEINEVRLAERLHLLAPWEIAAIVSDDRTNQLHFIGRGTTDAEAVSIAEGLRTSFLDGDPFTSVVDLTAQLESVANRIKQLRVLVAEATAVPPSTLPGEADLTTIAGLQALQAQIDALITQYNALSVELLNPVFRSSAAIEEERATVLAALVALQLQMQTACAGSNLPPCLSLAGTGDPSSQVAAPDEEQEFEQMILQIESEQLEETYRALIQRSLELPATIAEVEVRESSVEAVNLVTNQVLAAVAGLLVGIIGLLLADRIRKPIWTVQEVDGRIALPEVAPRGWSVPQGVWYLSKGPGTRKAGIQTLRAIVEGLTDGTSRTVGIVGLAVEPDDIQELSADLAASVAVSGSKALLIDANFDDPSELVEYGLASQNLSKALAQIEDGRVSADEALTHLRPVGDKIEGLKGLRAGRPLRDGPDLLSRPPFVLLLEAAKAQFDVVVVSGAPVASPITQVLSQRLDHLIFLGSTGHSLEADYAAAVRELSDRRAETAGMALMTGGRRRLGRLVGRLFRRRSSKSRNEAPTRELPGPRRGKGRDGPDSGAGQAVEQTPLSANGDAPYTRQPRGTHERARDPG